MSIPTVPDASPIAAGSAVAAALVITTAAELLAAARRAGLELTSSAADLDRSGLDFLVLHGRDARGTPWIVRTPRRPEVAAAARVEARVLALVRGQLPVAVPHWRIHTDEVIAYPRLEGIPVISLDRGAPRWNLDPAAPSDAFLDSLARALVALQAIPEGAGRTVELPSKPLDETREAYARAIEATRDALQPPAAVHARWQSWLASSSWPAHLALVHGDLHPGHLLLDRTGALSGILDWTEGHFGDPATDLAMCFGCFGPAVFARLLARFAHHGGLTWPRLVEHVAERWAFFPVIGAEWALRTGNRPALEHARTHLAAAVPGS